MNDSPPLIYGWTLVAVVLGPVALLAVVAFFVERQRKLRNWQGPLTDAEREAMVAAIRLLEHSTLGSADRTRVGLLSIYRRFCETA